MEFEEMIKTFKNIIKRNFLKNPNIKKSDSIKKYLKNGRIPWSKGYHQYKEEFITAAINNHELLEQIKSKSSLNDYGYRLDERVIEYPWIFSKINTENQKILDAGSTFNFNFIINHLSIKSKDLTIFTFAPEANNFCDKKVSYVYGDLRILPFKDELFDVVVSQSTIEHIDMDNSIYGYDITHNKDSSRKSYEYLKAVQEMIRVLKSNGNLLLTFPFGKFENHGFFQQFDSQMLERIIKLLEPFGTYDETFFQYKNDSWNFSNKEDLKDVVSHNPHTGKGKLDDGAAHCRSIVCLHFIKN
ncbi:class I SAM-dependent methyltransferase [Sabulilitoribacter multivorans]|uniref:Class I SAM-dependent methyltransferase n=1 Tax=Flaviramulus multivorans TaxID=1304750 RepID=A0ABS9IHU0_9FLAO|nr:methyltransferase domain-containing protein [Flaviramulus multivorans]MCF7560329.1 class I SAM-dependent methyltransferase [Flaviramulus multivorans]